jgi:hypothetical protein
MDRLNRELEQRMEANSLNIDISNGREEKKVLDLA